MRSRNRKAALSITGCCMAIFWSGYLAFGYPGIMSTFWQEKYNVGAAETGSVVTFMLFALAVCMFFSGRIHMKVGMRKCILIGTAFNVTAMVIVMNAESIYGVYLWGFVVNLGCSFIYGPGLTTAQQWMPHRKGLASGILNLVFGTAAAVMSPVSNLLMEIVGYDRMNMILIMIIAATDIVAMFFAESPDRVHFTDQEKEAHRMVLEEAALKNRKAGHVSDADLSTGQALRSKYFWIIWLVWVFMGAAGISMVSLSGNYAVSLGLSGTAILMAFNVVNGGGRIVAGVLSDVIGGERTGAIVFSLTAVAYAVMAGTGDTVPVVISAACVGFGFGTLFTITGPVLIDYFGMKYFGMIFGVTFTAYGFIGGIMGPALSGFILDKTGDNYAIVFSYLAVMAFTGALLMLLLQKQRKHAVFKSSDLK